MADEQHQPRRRYLLGILALLSVVLIWVASSFAMNGIFSDLEYNKPFLVTYLNTATFSFYLIPILFKRKILRLWAQYSRIPSSSQDLKRDTGLDEESSASHQSRPDKLSLAETATLSFQFCILWFFANYTTNASLAYTSVGSSTILASMSGFFTLGVGALFHVERLTLAKLASVCLSFVGVILVSYSDQLNGNDDPSNTHNTLSPLVGDLLALLGAAFYGCYTTLLKFRIGDEDRIDMPLFFGFVGAFNVFLLWPAFPILDWLGIEPFQMPTNPTIWVIILLNAFVGTFLSDYLWLLAMLMTSPLVVTLGISLTIPLALVGDVLFKHIVPGAQYALGALLVVLGFFSVNVAALKETNEGLVSDEQAFASSGDVTLIPKQRQNNNRRYHAVDASA